MRRSWMLLLLAALWVPGAWSARAAAAPAPGPRLLQYRLSGEQTVRFAVELPQADGSVLLARLEGCTLEKDVRELFGLPQGPIARLEELSRLSEPSAFALLCPDSTPEDARVFVDPTRQISYLHMAAPGAAETYLVIPNRCAALLSHFRIPERARRQALAARPGALGTQPPPGSGRRMLSCGKEEPAPPTTGWRVQKVQALGLADAPLLVRLRKGEVSIALDSIDGRPFDRIAAEGEEAERAVLHRLQRLFSAPAEDELEFLSNDDPALAGPLFDLCLDRCGEPGWTPAHKRVVNDERACLEGALAADGTCSQQNTFHFEEKLQLDGGVRKRARLPGVLVGLPTCGTSETWERRLGLARLAETGSWLDTMKARFLEAPPPAGEQEVLELPCLKEPPTCRLPLPDGVKLSNLSLGETVRRRCKAGDEVLELVLGKSASVAGRPFVVSQEGLPPPLKRVRLTGTPGVSSVITVSPPRCVRNKDTACTEAQPTLLIQGDLEIELAHLRLLPLPSQGDAPDRTSPPLPLARVGIRAVGSEARGLTLRLSHVDIGDGEQAPFYAGLQFSGGSLALFNTNVRAFSEAVTVEQARVSIAAWPRVREHELVSLAQPGAKTESLKDLRGRRLDGSVVHFRALSLSSQTQAFLAGMKVRGPLNVFWAADREAQDEPGLLSLDTHFTNGSGLFPRESVMLSVQGRGLLHFELPRVEGVANVIDCPSRPFPGAPTSQPRILFEHPAFEHIRHAQRNGICDVVNPFPWKATHQSEEDS